MTIATHNFTTDRAGRRALIALRIMAVLALLFFGARALWLEGYSTGTDTAECLDLFTVVGNDAADYDVCQRARKRWQNDPLARAFANDAELKLRREAAASTE